MRAYIVQLLEDLKYATNNASFPFTDNLVSLHDFLTAEEEEAAAPKRDLSEWTGIKSEMLPPSNMLDDQEINVLLIELIKMLEAYNCHFVLQTQVPERFQYETIRQNICQEVKIKQWNMGFFEVCKPNTEYKTCSLGDYCQCAFYEEIFKDMIHEEFEQDRKQQLNIEINHIKRKYGDDWMKYYPYHLDENYDDENGNPYNYGFGDSDDDQWWRQ